MENPGPSELSPVPGQMEVYRKALESARSAFNEILTIRWGWDGDCGALAYANDGFDTCDEALKSSLVPEIPKSDSASGVPKDSSPSTPVTGIEVEKWEVEARALHFNILRNGTPVYEGCTSEWYAKHLVEQINASLERILGEQNKL